MTAISCLYVDERGVTIASDGVADDRSPTVAAHSVGFPPIWLPREPDELLPLAKSIGELLAPIFPNGTRARLAIPSHWCLCQVVSCEETEGSTEGAVYAFEEDIPVELEHLTVVDFKLGPRHALVVGVFTEPVRAFLELLQAQRIEIEALTVDIAMCFSKGLQNSRNTGDTDILSDPVRVTVAASPAGDTSPLIRTYQVTDERPHQDYQRRLTNAAVGSAVPANDVDSARASRTERPFSIRSALTGLSTGLVPIDLRRGGLAYSGRWRPLESGLRRCALSTIVLFVILCVRGLWDIALIDGALTTLRGAQAELYHQVFPGDTTPDGATLRVQSERVRLEALTQSGGSGDVPGLQSGMDTFLLLHELTARIPTSVKLHVNELDVDSAGIRVSGQANNHAAAGDWVQEINRAGVLQAEPPRTKLRKDGTVDFRIHARRPKPHEGP